MSRRVLLCLALMMLVIFPGANAQEQSFQDADAGMGDLESDLAQILRFHDCS